MRLRSLGMLVMIATLTACQPGDKKDSATPETPASPAPAAPAETEPVVKPAASPEEESFRRAFSLATAPRTFVRTEVVLRQSSLITDDTLENWAASCAGSVALSAEFPIVRFGLGALSCEGSELPPAVVRLLALVKNFEYSAKHLPALPDHPDQFRLDLDVDKIAGRARWEEARSLNSVARPGILSFDFSGAEARSNEFDAGTHVWLAATIQQVEGGETLEVEYVFDDFDRREKTTIRLKTKLEAVP